MKEVPMYQCEICGALFATREQASECEREHVSPVEIVKVRYTMPDTSVPSNIDVRMSDGSLVKYEISKIRARED